MTFSQLVALALKATTIVANQLPLSASTSDTFQWAHITPRTYLEWHNCFDDFKCARVSMPMDWHHNTSETNATTDLAVIKLEATVPITHPSYGGLVFFNPGGPGGSGVKQVLDAGHDFRTLLSANSTTSGKHYDIISFDNRGINNSRPLLTCFPNHLESAAWTIEKHAEGFIGDAPNSFNNLWARLRGLAEDCSTRAETQAIARHMSTAPVARDVLEIFELHGQWREVQAQRLTRFNMSLSQADRQTVYERTAFRSNEEMIQYWGFSYGSILGAHLAAMYPARVSRMVLDGVADSRDYMSGDWTTNLQDTDMIFAKMAEYCWLGGEKNCPIWHKDGPAAIVDRVLIILEHFQQNPISRPGNATHGPVLVTYHDYEVLIREAVYNLMTSLPIVAQVIYELGNGIATTLEAYKTSHLPDLGYALSSDCLKDGPYSPACQRGEAFEAGTGILCTDGLSRSDQTKYEYRDYANMLISQSSLIGASWAEIQMPCTAWKTRASWRYSGDFVATTLHPLLFIGNTFDPVTPLRNAFVMANGFAGSRVLQQDNGGHCSYAVPSMCTAKSIRNYFQTGELPTPNTNGSAAFCKPDLIPLHGYDRDSPWPDLPDGESDDELWDALINLNRALP